MAIEDGASGCIAPVSQVGVVEAVEMVRRCRTAWLRVPRGFIRYRRKE